VNRTSNPTSWLVDQIQRRINLIYARTVRGYTACDGVPECEACDDDLGLVSEAAEDLMTFWEDLKARLTDVSE
jgi:hypothetical protein